MLIYVLKQLIICKSRSPIAKQTGSVCVADVELACRCLYWIHFLISIFFSSSPDGFALPVQPARNDRVEAESKKEADPMRKGVS